MRSDKNKKINVNKKGFTLIEAMLAVVLVGGVFLGIYSIFNKTVVNDEESKNEVIASNLAQEGVEIVRNIRDENVLNPPKSINSDLSGTCYPFWDGTSAVCDNNHIAGIEKDSSTGLYSNCASAGCNPVEETIFLRTCYIEDVDGDPTEAFAVSCVVEWTGLAGIERSARAMSILTDWQSNH